MPASRLPHPSLRPLVTAYAGYHDVMDPRAVHHGLPSSSLTVIVAFDEPLDCGWVAAPEDQERFWTLAAGLHTAPALIRTHGRQHGIQLGLTPLGARVLLGVPAGALGGELAAHAELPRGLGDDVHARLAALDGWEARFEALDEELRRLVGVYDDQAPPAAEVTEAWRCLRASRGRAPIARVAERVGWSRRRLLDAFTAEFGLSPKQAARIFRFEHARSLVERGAALADVAAAAGFSDQAHLSREWRALAGRTPTQLSHSAYHLA